MDSHGATDVANGRTDSEVVLHRARKPVIVPWRHGGTPKGKPAVAAHGPPFVISLQDEETDAPLPVTILPVALPISFQSIRADEGRVFSSTRIESKPGSIIGEIARQFVHEFQVPIVREKLPREVSLHAFDFGTAVPFSELMRQTNGEVVTLLRDLNLCFLDSGPTNPRPSLRRDGCPNYAIINNGSGPRVVRVKRMDRSANYQIDMTPIIVGGGKANKCEPRCRVFSRVPLVGWTPSEQK